MDEILLRVTQQAMNYAIRSGITITSTYAISQCSRLMKTQAKDSHDREELGKLQRRLENKIRIISPAIDMIELITARGNTSLESALTLTKSLRWDIQALGVRLSKAAGDEELTRQRSSKAKTTAHNDVELKAIISDMRHLLERIEDAVPLINLAITTSGVSLSTNLPASISPSRLLQASTFLSTGDAQYATQTAPATQIGPAFTLSIYMLFSGHSLPSNDDHFRNTIWQEVIHKARVKLVRTSLHALEDLPFLRVEDSDHGGDEEQADTGFPASIPAAGAADEFAYQLQFVEDLDDGRVHTLEDGELEPARYDDVPSAGICEVVPIHQVSKIFYADTGKILNIGTEGEVNNPVLLLKRDVNAAPPRRMMRSEDNTMPDVSEYEEHGQSPSKSPRAPAETDELTAQFAREMSHEQHSSTTHDSQRPMRFPPGLDPEWTALEVFNDEDDADDASDPGIEEGEPSRSGPSPTPSPLRRESYGEPSMTSALANLRLSPASTDGPSTPNTANALVHVPRQATPAMLSQLTTALTTTSVRTSLSLLEMLIRLTSLQQFQQASHLTINDELLNFFLEESSTTGAAPGDAEARKRIRLEARARVGFDPYDESPIKRRGEQYQYANDDEWAEERSRNGDHRSPFSPRTPLGYLQRPSPALRPFQNDRSSSRASTPGVGYRQPTPKYMRQARTPSSAAMQHSALATPPDTLKPGTSSSQAVRAAYSSPLPATAMHRVPQPDNVKVEDE